MTNRALARVQLLLVVLFAVLAVRQFYVQVIAAPSIAARPFNPRHQMMNVNRGRVLASDGTVLAQTRDGKRIYPFGPALAHALGYVSTRYGTSGLERAYDAALSPADETGDPVAQAQRLWNAIAGTSNPERGADIVTTLEPAVQQALYDQLSRHARGAGVVIDPRSGAVLALASVPSFDPNRIDADFAGIAADASSPLLDRALDGLYPPGSTFKIVTASGALESGAVSLQSSFDDPGFFKIGTFTLHDDEGEATGRQTLDGAFALSSNVDFAQIALKMGADAFYDTMTRWGIGAALDFQLPASPARIPSKDALTPGELAQMGFGQGALLVSPLQMALIASTVAADGVEPRPFIVRQTVAGAHARSVFSSAPLTTPISADTAAQVKKMMIDTVRFGTGTSARIAGVVVAGKTGTATNPFGRAHSWFVCFAPADHPRVVVAVIVENAGYGAEVAAPIAREVLRTALQSSTS